MGEHRSVLSQQICLSVSTSELYQLEDGVTDRASRWWVWRSRQQPGSCNFLVMNSLGGKGQRHDNPVMDVTDVQLNSSKKRRLGGSCVSLLNIKQLNQKSEGLFLLCLMPTRTTKSIFYSSIIHVFDEGVNKGKSTHYECLEPSAKVTTHKHTQIHVFSDGWNFFLSPHSLSG